MSLVDFVFITCTTCGTNEIVVNIAAKEPINVYIFIQQ